jgi:predicted lipoprotein with Yx(FWY)xxD motif
MKPLLITRAVTFALFVTTIASACKKSSQAAGTSPAAITGVVLTSNSSFGNILTDNNGKSLYFFFNDASSTSTCAGDCAMIWPAFYVANPTYGPGLSASDFNVITRTDGTKQITYKNWPVYYYADDDKAGDVNGDKVNNLWAVAKPDYTVMVANAQLVGLDGMDYNDLSVAGTGVSQYLTDAYGRTLYLFSKDSANENHFTKPDFSNNPVWPIDQVSTVGSIPSVFGKSQFSTIGVYGKTQLVCKNRPLYYFGQDDSLRGSTKGVSFPTPGAAIWKVINDSTTVLQ